MGPFAHPFLPHPHLPISPSPSATRIACSPGADLLSLLYNLLDEFLFRFTADDCMVCKEVRVLEFDTDNGRMKVQA